VAFRLHRGWVEALEKSLLRHGRELQKDGQSPTMSAVMQTVAAIRLEQFQQPVARQQSSPKDPLGQMMETLTSVPRSRGKEPGQAVQGTHWPAMTGRGLGQAMTARRASSSRPEDSFLGSVSDLRSGDPARVRRVLAEGLLQPELVGHAIPLLAWEEVSSEVIDALRATADRTVGQLGDALLDQDTEFAIRRRLPRTLCNCESPRAIQTLLAGLHDRRFEVRFQCGQALARIRDAAPDVAMDRDLVMAVVRREVDVGQGVWQSQRLLDRLDSTEQWSLVDEFIKERTDLSLQHVFTLLSLILQREPLKIAYRGLQTDESALRGTALEYLESVLPPDIRQRLWPYLEGSAKSARDSRPREQILADLMRSNQSIELNLKRLRQSHSKSSGNT
jgi:hypothetical protein